MAYFPGQHIPTIQLEGTDFHGHATEPNQYEASNQYQLGYAESFHTGEQPYGTSMSKYSSDCAR